jgi:hypothetical protein
MNLLKIYIEEIHSEEEITHWGDKLIRVDLTRDCHGGISREEKLFTPGERERVKAQGFWIG